ncbi:hypothetical protein [Methanobrevibacter sp. UBA212]|uniref:hypothetical protein n=1 Tax=Methanobrevibacter sp. UBA212 TaxID=1915476 RepID=UPI0025FD3A5E|nr:hypothetical protein [Methanobrevibacter sp. UBA212]
MNNKVKQVLVLLFVVSTLLIMIGSVSANTDNLNENLEASNTLNDDLSAVPDVDSGADKDVSNQLTISNIDEKTNGSSSLGESDSENVVSNYEDTTIDSKDSDNNIIKASNEGNVLSASPNMVITNTVLNPVVNKGDFVDFNIFVRNEGDAAFQGINPVGDGWFVGISLVFDSNQLRYDHFTPGINPDTLQTHKDTYRSEIRNGNNEIWFGYNCEGGFQPGWCINFTATFQVLSYGTLETGASIMWGGTPSKARTTSRDSELVITNTAIYPNVNKNGEATFEVSVKNNGGTYQGLQDSGTYFVGLQLNYDTNQLEYTGVSYDTPSRYLDVRNNWWDSNVQFAYKTNGAFRYGESFKFNVIFKVKTTGTLRTDASIVLYNAQASTAYVNAVNPPEFEITNVASLPISNTGDQVSFELTVKNNGDTFYPTYILGERFVGVNFWYDNNGLHYANVTSSNPDMYLTPRVNPDNNKRLVQFAYKVGDAGFAKGDSFKLNVIFDVLAHGTFETNAQITQYTQVSSRASTTSMAPVFEITNTLSNSYVNINDNVSFEVSGKNVGGTFRDNVLGVGFEYNDTQLEYQSLTPNADSEKYNLNPNPNPSFDLYENGLVVGYNSSQMFYHGDTFNFTLTFKVLQHGKFETTAFWWQGWGVRSVVRLISNDTNLLMSEIPNALTMKVGDTVFFTYVVKNEGVGYKGSDITLNIYFDADKMEYLGISEVENLNVELLEYISTHNSDNSVLGATYGSLLGADSSVGHLKLSYTPEDGFAGGDSFNFNVQFNALTDGKLQANSVLEWDHSKYSTMVSAYTFAGDPSFKLTKTADNQFVNIGDFVAYEVILENNGTLQYTDNGMVIYINDWYPEGLKYYGSHINPGSDGVVPIIEINDRESGHVQFKYDLYRNNLTEGWAPGSKLNITLFFEVVKDGILCNFVFSEWNTSDVSSVVSGEPEINLTKKCLNSTVDVGDLVYYEIYLENTGAFDYFDHATGGVVGTNYFIIEDIYPEGLDYVGYIVNPDKNGNMWKDNYEFVGKDGDNRVIIKYKIWNQRWKPGDSLNVTLIFNATDVGKLTNHANFYWLWDDTITGSGNSINLTEEADVIVGPPTFSIDKISNYQEAKVGDVVSFSIVYSNTGNRTITGAYIKDSTYSQGLEFYDFSDKELWTFDGKDTWYYNNKLGAGESATLELFFKALTAGRKSNTATAGHNINNETLEDTDTVLIKEGVNGTAETEGTGISPDEPEDEPDEEPEEEPVEKHNESDTVKVKDSVAAKNTLHETGNPLFVLLLSLLTLCFVQRKGKK